MFRYHDGILLSKVQQSLNPLVDRDLLPNVEKEIARVLGNLGPFSNQSTLRGGSVLYAEYHPMEGGGVFSNDLCGTRRR